MYIFHENMKVVGYLEIFSSELKTQELCFLNLLHCVSRLLHDVFLIRKGENDKKKIIEN